MSTAIPLIPETAPFSPEQRAWLNGFFAGLFSRGVNSGPELSAAGSPGSTASALIPLTILFGSQTGTAEGLAKRAAKEAGRRGFAATVVDMAQTDATQLAAEKNLLVITSTYGDGEPPDNAKALHTALAAAAPGSALGNLRFSVCSLGDRNYTQFCKCGADFDAWLEKLGATRITSRSDCDVEYEETFSAWLNTSLTALATAGAATGQTAQGASTAPAANPSMESSASSAMTSDDSSRDRPSATATTRPPSGSTRILETNRSLATRTAIGRTNPFLARVLTSRLLNAPGSAKQVHHVEFDLADSGLIYDAGDALGVVPHNCPSVVAEILAALGCDGEEAVPAPDGSTTSLRHALTECYDLGKPTAELLAMYAPGVTAGAPHHVIDAIVARADLKLSPLKFVGALKKLQPRLYSIASSPAAHAGEVHLTVGAVRYDLHGRTRAGVCSTFLADRVAPGESRVGIFVHSNKAFRPPPSGDTPIIMVGPGTGIAPFRAFLHERKATGASGRNWLFFGDQRASSDFLYRDELAELMREGVLTRLDTAFSRDQREKIYVQHRMIEHASEVYAWLEAGAHFYICGDAARMAKDVDAALHTVVQTAAGKTTGQAAEYVQALKSAKRYCRDVY